MEQSFELSLEKTRFVSYVILRVPNITWGFLFNYMNLSVSCTSVIAVYSSFNVMTVHPGTAGGNELTAKSGTRRSCTRLMFLCWQIKKKSKCEVSTIHTVPAHQWNRQEVNSWPGCAWLTCTDDGGDNHSSRMTSEEHKCMFCFYALHSLYGFKY